MTDEEVIEAFHRALVVHEAAKDTANEEDYAKTYDAVAAAERMLNEHFGVANGWRRYRAVHPR